MTSDLSTHNTLTVLPATPDRWQDIEQLFERTPCWCQYWRVSARRYGRGSMQLLEQRISERRRALQRQLDGEIPPGVLAYLDGQSIGWCGFGPRAELERLAHSRTIPQVDQRPVWSIVCFLVRPGYRRRGVARALLQGAIACARSHGVPALEAYPVDLASKRIDATFAYVGTVAMFEREGFRRVTETAARSAGLPRWVMQLDLTRVE